MPRKGDVRESFEIIRAMLTGKEEPPSRKFLAEQRLAYAFIGFSIVLLMCPLILNAVYSLTVDIQGYAATIALRFVTIVCPR